MQAAPSIQKAVDAWAFVLSANVASAENMAFTVHNPRTGDAQTMTAMQTSDNLQVVWADLSSKAVIATGDVLEIHVHNETGQFVGTLHHKVTPEDVSRAFAQLHLDQAAMHPTQTALFANYPNPFNPETWLPYQLAKDANVQIHIYDSAGRSVRTLDLGFQNSGFYLHKDSAAYWNGRNNAGEKLASGMYFYHLYFSDSRCRGYSY